MMDLSENRIPERVRSVHLIAVCGTGMGALACMLRESGLDVTGSDADVYPPMSDFLAGRGIFPMKGFSADNLSHKPDLVVVGNAVSANNTEVLAMFGAKIPFCSMPQAVRFFAAKGKKEILVAGTHGKTTISSIITWILSEAGLDPSFFIGGIHRNFDSNYRLGKGEHIVIEGDEYDTAFFDKGPKFLHYDPHLAVLSGIEFDHADIYRDLDHVRRSFEMFAAGMSPESGLIVFGGDPEAVAVTRNRDCRVISYGDGPSFDWRLTDVLVDSPWTGFRVFHKGALHGEFRTKMMGTHNLLNALSAIAVADNLSIPVDAVKKGIEGFAGARRRQEIRGEVKGIMVIDDFAHHPTAVRETVKAIRTAWPENRLVAVFEPRTNTSMRRVFQDVYPKVFDPADLVLIRMPSRLDKIPENERFSSRRLVEDLNLLGKEALHFEDTRGIIDYLAKNAVKGDRILIMSNGGFDDIHRRLLKRLS